VNETGRLVSLAVATLLANGATEPRRHLFLAAAGKVATLIVAKSPLSPSALKDAAKANEFTVLLGPDTAAPSATLEKIVRPARFYPLLPPSLHGGRLNKFLAMPRHEADHSAGATISPDAQCPYS